MPEIIEIIAHRHPKRRDRYNVYLGDTLIEEDVRLPFYDGARALLSLGYPGSSLVTMRHHGCPHPSFELVPISVAAKLSVTESNTVSLRVTEYQPHPLAEARRQEKRQREEESEQGEETVPA